MVINAVGILIFLSLCGVVTSNPDRAIDCRKFVFAPLCRGVAAKRGYSFNLRKDDDFYLDDDRSLENLLRTFYEETIMRRAENNKEEDIRRPLKTNGKETPIATYLGLLFRNGISNSESNSFPVKLYENL